MTLGPDTLKLDFLYILPVFTVSGLLEQYDGRQYEIEPPTGTKDVVEMITQFRCASNLIALIHFMRSQALINGANL